MTRLEPHFPTPALGSLYLSVHKEMCQTPFLRYVRPHRRRRIQKKWAKRFGQVLAPCKGYVYKMARTAFSPESLACCPHGKAKIEAAFEQANMRLKEKGPWP